MVLRHKTAVISLLAAPLAALMLVGPAQGATVTPDQVSGAVISGLTPPLVIGVAKTATFTSDGLGTAQVKYEYWSARANLSSPKPPPVRRAPPSRS